MLPRSAPRSVASVVVILPREESRFDGRSVPWRLFVMRSIGTAFFCSTPATVTGTFVHGRGAGRASTPKAVREDAAVGDIETWTADECAAAWGVKTPTWLG